MAEDNNLEDIDFDAEMHRSDSNRRYVSTFSPTSCQKITTNAEVHEIPRTCKNVAMHDLANTVNIDLSKYLENMHCKNAADDSEIQTELHVAQKISLSTGKQRDSPFALPTTSETYDIALPFSNAE